MNPKSDTGAHGDGGRHEDASPPQARPTTRRRFVTLFGRLLLLAWGVGALAVIGRFIRPRSRHHRRDEVLIPESELELLDVGDAMLIPETDDPIHLVRVAPTDFVALSATCTHLRCILAYERDSRTFVCPCHRGQFDLNGNVLGGLPSTPLTRHRAVYRFGEVVVAKV